MTPDEAREAVGGFAVARYAHGDGEHGRGRIVSYSIVPTFTIEQPDGTRFDWRYDLCEVAEDDADGLAQTAALTRDLLEVSRLPVDDPRRAEWVARKDAALAEVES